MNILKKCVISERNITISLTLAGSRTTFVIYMLFGAESVKNLFACSILVLCSQPNKKMAFTRELSVQLVEDDQMQEPRVYTMKDVRIERHNEWVMDVIDMANGTVIRIQVPSDLSPSSFDHGDAVPRYAKILKIWEHDDDEPIVSYQRLDSLQSIYRGTRNCYLTQDLVSVKSWPVSENDNNECPHYHTAHGWKMHASLNYLYSCPDPDSAILRKVNKHAQYGLTEPFPLIFFMPNTHQQVRDLFVYDNGGGFRNNVLRMRAGIAIKESRLGAWAPPSQTTDTRTQVKYVTSPDEDTQLMTSVEKIIPVRGSGPIHFLPGQVECWDGTQQTLYLSGVDQHMNCGLYSVAYNLQELIIAPIKDLEKGYVWRLVPGIASSSSFFAVAFEKTDHAYRIAKMILFGK